MTTLEFMQKQLKKHENDLVREANRKAPEVNLENIKNKIAHYTKVCDLLMAQEEGGE